MFLHCVCISPLEIYSRVMIMSVNGLITRWKWQWEQIIWPAISNELSRKQKLKIATFPRKGTHKATNHDTKAAANSPH